MLWNCHIKPEKLNFFLFNFILLFTLCKMSPFFPLCPPPPSPHPLPPTFPQAITTELSESLSHGCPSANAFTFSHQTLLPTPLWQLSTCSMYPCLCFYSAHQLILFIRKSLWYLSFTDWLILLSIIISRLLFQLFLYHIKYVDYINDKIKLSPS